MSVRKFFDVAACHVTQRDMKLLQNDISPSTVWQHPTEPAVFFWCQFGATREEEDADTDEDQRLSDAFWAVVERAKQLDCDYVMIDRDGPTVDGLEVFEW